MSTSDSDESNHLEKLSTNDELSRSDFDEDSESGSESDNEEEDDVSLKSPDETNEARRLAKLTKRRRQHQSDTETRNLLDDVGDLDDEILDLEETKESSGLDIGFFDISDEQLDYYTNCFFYLQRKTVGHATLGGAVPGSDVQVVEFFRKSKLDTHTLSRVWALADVNEDGYLNHSEFVIAMHLIVLHLKGSVPIPSRLPSPVRPCATPVRFSNQPSEFQNSTASSTLSNSGGFSQDNGSTSKNSDSLRLKAPNQSGDQKQHSLSDDHLHVYNQHNDNVVVTDFSDAPPVLVDNRPQALNAQTSSKGMALLNSLASKGPPPQPPSRDYNNAKGHGRSASLDLKVFSNVPSFSGYTTKLLPASAAGSTQSELKPTSAFDSYSQTHSLYTNNEHWNPTQQAFPPTSQAVAGGSLPTINPERSRISSVPPPLPPHRPLERSTVETQTEPESTTTLDSDALSSLMQDTEKMNIADRCKLLKRYNNELEMEKATLSQIRLQLQLRIEESLAALRSLGIDVDDNDA